MVTIFEQADHTSDVDVEETGKLEARVVGEQAEVTAPPRVAVMSPIIPTKARSFRSTSEVRESRTAPVVGLSKYVYAAMTDRSQAGRVNVTFRRIFDNKRNV